MSRFAVVLVFALVGCLMLAGCTGSEEPAAKPAPEPLDEETTASAVTRGVSPKVHVDDADEAKPQVVLAELTYEWRTSPERGVQVTMEFTNPVRTYERARGYVFLVAESTMSGSRITGVYPWKVAMREGLPEDYTGGTHLLYRDSQQLRAFIPYTGSSGYYETLRLFVFHEDGRLLTNRTYDMKITGEQDESRTINPGFDL